MRSLPVYRPLYPSASKLALAFQCPAVWSRGYQRTPREVDGQEWGHAVHRAIERYYYGTFVAEHIADEEATGAEEARRLRELLGFVVPFYEADKACFGTGPGSEFFVEQGLAYDPRTRRARRLARKSGQELQGEFGGTVDLAYVRADGVLVVADWKTGAQSARLDDAEGHYQLWGLAVYLLRYLGVDLAGVPASGVVARVELRHVDESGVEVDGADITAGASLLFEYDLGELAARVDTAAAPAFGDHCERLWCPARGACPRYAAEGALVVQESGVDLAEGLLRRMARTPEEAVAQWLALQATRSASPLLEEHLRAYVLAHGPLVVGPGVELRAVAPKTGRLLQTPEALTIVEEVVPGAVRVEEVRSCSLEDVDAAAGKVAEGIASRTDRAAARKRAIAEARAALAERGVLGGGKMGMRLVRARHKLDGDWVEEAVGKEDG